jgi:hypothetical protein
MVCNLIFIAMQVPTDIHDTYGYDVYELEGDKYATAYDIIV